MPSKLIELEIARAGIWGVNTRASGDVMPKEFAVRLENYIFSEEGFVEARRGSRQQHAATLQSILGGPNPQNVRQIFNTTDENGDDLTIFSTEKGMWRLSGATVTLISGAMTTPTAGNWKFVNLNNEIYGFQAGHTACKLATPSTGTFVNAVFTGANAPVNTTSSIVVDAISAFGRIWVLEGDDLIYSSTLLPENWDIATDAGRFTLTATYLNGKDKPTALAEFNGNLLTLAENHVTIWGNPWNPNDSGANYGNGQVSVTTDTAPMQVTESIGGVGCVARDSIQYTQNDMLFLSNRGITALSRVIQEKSMPVALYSDNIGQETLELIRRSEPEDIWSAYLPARGTYLYGSGSVTALDETYLLDVSQPLPDATYRAITWQKKLITMSNSPQRGLAGSDEVWDSLLLGETTNFISKIDGYQDDQTVAGGDGNSYDISYESAWTAINEDFENNIKIPKKIGVVLRGSGAQTFDVNIAFDYGDFVDSKARTGTAVLSSPSVYGVHTYGGTTEDTSTAYYGAATSIKQTTVMGFGQGRIVKVKVGSTVDGFPVSLQRISIFSKIGRQQ